MNKNKKRKNVALLIGAAVIISLSACSTPPQPRTERSESFNFKETVKLSDEKSIITKMSALDKNSWDVKDGIKQEAYRLVIQEDGSIRDSNDILVQEAGGWDGKVPEAEGYWTPNGMLMSILFLEIYDPEDLRDAIVDHLLPNLKDGKLNGEGVIASNADYLQSKTNKLTAEIGAAEPASLTELSDNLLGADGASVHVTYNAGELSSFELEGDKITLSAEWSN